MKRVHWIGSSLEDVREFPGDARSEVGYAIYLAQMGDKAVNAVPLVGFGSSKVLEIVANQDGDTYRTVYTVKFKHAVYVLHAFQKKSKKGIKTPATDIDLVKSRLKVAERHYRTIYASKLAVEK